MKKILAAIVLIFLSYLFLPVHVQMGIKHTFANVDDYKIFPHHTIQHSRSPKPWTLSVNYNKFKPSEELNTFFSDRQTCAFLVIKNGKIAYEYYGQDYNKGTISGSFSMAKTVNALLIGKLLQEGKIGSLDDDIKKYVPHLKHIPEGKLTIRNVLMMSADIDWDESYWNPFSLTAESYYGNDLEKLMNGLQLRKSRRQGKLWEYQSCCTQILGYIIVNVTHKSLAENAQEFLWRPLGAESDALWSTDGKGMEKSFCCLNATARDFARLGQMVLQKGKWDSIQVIDSSYISRMISPDNQLKDITGHSCDWYGYQTWMINYKGRHVPYFRGILGQFIFMVHDENAVIVRLGKIIKRDPNDPKFQNDDIRNYIKTGLQVLDQN
jgi:CubicO group peptidase (beta-lactamase class C family)